MTEILFAFICIEILFIFILAIWFEIRATIYARRIKLIQDHYDKLFNEHILFLKEQNSLMKEMTLYLNDTLKNVKSKKEAPVIL